VWKCKHTFLTVKGADGLPGERLHLLIVRNVLNPDEVKFFVSNVAEPTGVGTLLHVACSRWRIETAHPNSTSSARWCGHSAVGYNPCVGVA